MWTRASKLHGVRQLCLYAVAMLAMTAALAISLQSPSESLGGLTPGKDTIRDAEKCYGAYSAIISGEGTYYAGGDQSSNAYLWPGNEIVGQRGLIIETSLTSRRIELIMVDMYPGIGTSCSLTALAPESEVTERYGTPDYAYQVRVANRVFRELFYVNKGLLVVLAQVPGRPNWTVTKLILTYPAYLRNGVAMRTQYAQQRKTAIEDITYSYRVWVGMAIPPE